MVTPDPSSSSLVEVVQLFPIALNESHLQSAQHFFSLSYPEGHNSGKILDGKPKLQRLSDS